MNPLLSVGIVVALMLVGLGVVLQSADGPGLEARLFSGRTELVCVQLDGQEQVHGTLVVNEILPGEYAQAQLNVTHCDDNPPGLLDLDVDFRSQLTDAPPLATPDLRHLIIITSFTHGPDNLLGVDPMIKNDRDLLREIDAVYGNNDGRLSLSEMQHGINDLPTPPEGGALFSFQIHLLPEAGNQYQADKIDLTIVFVLSDVLHGDLN